MTALEDKLSRYKEPSSLTEQDKQARAERMLRAAIDTWPGFRDIRIGYLIKGSYANNTNVRADSDVDVAVMHKGMYYFDTDLLRLADRRTGHVNIPHLPTTHFRAEMERALVYKYGSACDTTGNTAITIDGNSGRVSTDAVPSFDHVTYYYNINGYISERWGTITYRRDGSHVINYPQQQLDNGRAKNTATNSRYKQVVRILKRLENDFVARGAIQPLPSFFMECLVYPVLNKYFSASPGTATPLTEICTSVFLQIWSATKPGGSATQWLEPNEVKPLFASGQPWSMADGNKLALMAFGEVNA